jgi:hypothetical protein
VISESLVIGEERLMDLLMIEMSDYWFSPRPAMNRQ